MEAIEIVFDPAKVTYAQLLDVYWKNIDPTTPNRQFCDVGRQYHPAIFYHTPEQEKLAQETKRNIEASKNFPGRVVAELAPASAFYPAEDYHQEYYRKSPVQYKSYRNSCGRDERLKELWED